MSRSAALTIARLAAEHGNGAIDLTQRGMLQLRGIAASAVATVADCLIAAGLADADEASEAARNIVISPASDCDPSALLDAAALAARLEPIVARAASRWALPPKFGLLVDDGGSFPLDAVMADIRLVALRQDGKCLLGLALAGDGATATSIGLVTPDAVEGPVARLYEAASRLFPRRRPSPANAARWADEAGFAVHDGSHRLDRLTSQRLPDGLVELRPAFGRMTAAELRALATVIDDDIFLRPTVHRTLLCGSITPAMAERLIGLAERFGFLVAGDPLIGVSACVGAPACASAHADVRADARSVAKLVAMRPLHVSGCQKGCAHPAPAAMTLTAEPGGYRLGRDCCAGEGRMAGALPGMADQILSLTASPGARP